jgi:putative tryptophan/tyrosine transport system substrate-binding protein
MRRREFITALGGAVAVWPRAACAQQTPVVGLLHLQSPQTYALTGFRQGLKEAGFVEGQNVAVDYRWANSDAARLPELAVDLVQRRVAIIVTIASVPAALAAKAATTTIPIVFGFGGDPVELGLVASLNRPGGNITGAESMSGDLFGKQLGLLRELVPSTTRLAALVGAGPSTPTVIKDIQAAATAMGRPVDILIAGNISEIDSAFASLAQTPESALLITNSPLFIDRRVQVVTLASRHAIPTIYPFRENAEIGGLMVYGPNLQERDRQVGLYAGRILKGDKPAELPVIRSTKFEFIINLQTARTLKVTVPPTLLALTDEVIE